MMPPSASRKTTRHLGVIRLAAVGAMIGMTGVLGVARVVAWPGPAHHGTASSPQGRGDTSGSLASLPTDSSADEWLTAVLRPAGTLDRPAVSRLGQALGGLAASSDMVVLDLTAAHVADPGALARTLQSPALELDRTGRCLLLVGAAPEVMAELDRAAISVATLPAVPSVA